MISKAILLIRDCSQRSAQQSDETDLSPCTAIAGLPLLCRSLEALERLGVRDVLTIHERNLGDRLRRAAEADAGLSLRLHWAPVDSDPIASVCAQRSARQLRLTIKRFAEEPTLMVAGDLFFGYAALAPLNELADTDESALLVDRAVDRAYDPRGPQRLVLGASRVKALVGPDAPCDALAVGAALMTPAAVESWSRRSSGFCGEREFCQLAAAQRWTAVDVEGAHWQSVSSPQTLSHAQGLARVFGGDLCGGVRRVERSTARTADSSRTLAYIEGLLSEKRPRHNVLMNPGPVITSPRVKSALVHHDVCHRDEDYAAVVRRVQRKLCRVCRGGPDHEILLLSGSGTAAIEATLSSFVPPTAKLLVLSNGAFGERFAEIAATHRIETIHERYGWGELIDPAGVERVLQSDPSIAAVTMCHHETSVGLLNPVQEIGQLCRRRGVLFFVDAVSSLGAEDVNVRRDRVDVLISSANKCLHAVSGVSFVCVAPSVWERTAQVEPRVYYLDLKRYRQQQIPFTPAVSNFFALDAALDELLQEGIGNRIRHYRSVNDRIRKTLFGLGLRPLTQTGRESHTITTVQVPSYIEFAELYEALKKQGYVIYDCKEHLKGECFQVANMGELSDEMVDGFLEALEGVLRRARSRSGPQLVAAGS